MDRAPFRLPRTPGKAVAAVVMAALIYVWIYAYAKWLPRYDCIILPGLLGWTFAVLDGCRARARWIGCVSVTLLLLAGFVVHLWTLGYEGRNAVFGGILPWSDSRDFYTGALRLVHGGRLSEAASRRPLFPAVFAILLRLCGGNLRLVLALLVLGAGVAIVVATLEVWSTDGWRSALVVHFVLLSLERRFAGFIQSEHLGLIAGAIGFSGLWRAHQAEGQKSRSSLGLAAAGLYAVTVGLMARAGPLLVLPALGIGMALHWGAAHPQQRLRVAALAASSVLAGIGLHVLVLRWVGAGVGFSDYPAIVYGLIHRQDFTYLAAVHPQLLQLPLNERLAASWHAVYADVMASPGHALLNWFRSGLEFFVSPQGAFSYIWTNPDDHILENRAIVEPLVKERGVLGVLAYWVHSLGSLSIINTLCMGLIGVSFVVALTVALIKCVNSPRCAGAVDKSCSLAGSRNRLLRWVSIGVLLSAPFTPPWITSGVQVQTVTLPFVAALVAMFVTTQGKRSQPVYRRAPALAYCPAVASLAFLMLLAGLRRYPERVPQTVSLCSAPAAPHWLRIYPSTAVQVAEQRRFSFTSKAELDLRVSLLFLGKHFSGFAASVGSVLHGGTRYVAAYEPCGGQLEIILDPNQLTARQGGGWLLARTLPTQVDGVQRITSVASTEATPSVPHASMGP